MHGPARSRSVDPTVCTRRKSPAPGLESLAGSVQLGSKPCRSIWLNALPTQASIQTSSVAHNAPLAAVFSSAETKDAVPGGHKLSTARQCQHQALLEAQSHIFLHGHLARSTRGCSCAPPAWTPAWPARCTWRLQQGSPHGPPGSRRHSPRQSPRTCLHASCAGQRNAAAAHDPRRDNRVLHMQQ